MSRGRAVRWQRGATMLVVMVLMTVMLLGAIGMARHVEVGTVAAGNSAFRDVSLQVSEVGLNTAFRAVRDMPFAGEDLDAAAWYWATPRTEDAVGLPDVNWNAAPEVVVDAYRVRYVVERMCQATPVTDALRECLVRQVQVLGSARAEEEALDPPNSRQYRVTVRVTGPRGTTVFTQALVTKG